MVKAGDVVKVKVLEVDVARKRIALTMRLEDKAESKPAGQKATEPRRKKSAAPSRNQFANNAFADALKGWKK